MTLAAHLTRGALGAWFTARIAPAPVDDRLAEALRGRVPLRPPRHASPSHGALVQASVQARLGLAVQQAPHYRGLSGAARLGLATTGEVHGTAAGFPSHVGLRGSRRRVAWRWRPVGDRWVDVGAALPAARRRAPRQATRVTDHATRLLRVLEPPGRLADRAGERELAALCAETAGWAIGLPDLPDGASGRVDEVVDLVQLACESGLLTRWHRSAGHPTAGVPLGVVDAVFVPGWAHGGTVIGRALIDVLAVPDPLRHPDRVLRVLHHLVARAWLDPGHGIDRVGVYLARHGVLATWDVAELGGTRPDHFTVLARRAALADGVRLPAPTDLIEETVP